MLNSPDRGHVRKKWAVNKSDGPQIMFAELVQKKLHHHKVPCEYSFDHALGAVVFHPARWRREFGSDFRKFLYIAVAHVNAERRVSGKVLPASDQRFIVMLDGEHEISPQGILRPVKEKLSDRAKARKP